jgi:protein-tyrosine phosphatase
MQHTLEGLANFRDLGGIPVAGGGSIRPGLLFRSDSVAYATEADATMLVEKLGLRTVVDLRDTPEVEAFGRGPLVATDVGYVNLPIGDVGHSATRPEQYADMLLYNGPAVADLIRALGAPGFAPALIHCQIGCDRTGIVVAAILSLCGVADDEICADYARSTRASTAIRQRARDRRTALGLPQMPDSYYDEWEPVAAVMTTAIAVVVERWGGFDGWAATFGLRAVDVDAVRAVLVD